MRTASPSSPKLATFVHSVGCRAGFVIAQSRAFHGDVCVCGMLVSDGVDWDVQKIGRDAH